MQWNIAPEYISLLFLSVLLVSSKGSNLIPKMKNRLFRLCLYFVFFEIIVSIVSIIAIENYRMIPAIVNQAIQTVFFLASPFLAVIFMAYLIAVVREDDPKIPAFFRIIAIPYVLYAVLVLTNPLTGLLYGISESSGFTYGDGFLLTYAIPMLYMLSMILIIFLNRRKMERFLKTILLSFPIISLIMLGIQWIFPTLILSGSAATSALLIVYLYLQNNQIAIGDLIRLQNKEKVKRAEELLIANKELAFQNEEKEKRAAELIIANKELIIQNEEKEKRAAELVVANKELAFQNDEKDKRAAELVIANRELIFQTGEKAARAAELVIADKELAFQTGEKADRAAELLIADEELVFQSGEKADRAAELLIANKELVFQNEEKEKRAAELLIANIDLIKAYDTTIEGWSRGMDLRDKETEGHSLRVTEMTLRLAEKFGVDKTDLVNIRRGALLHDMGKMGIPDSILLKPGKLTDEEWGIMRKHPQFAVDMLSHITYLQSAMDIPFSHHEKWDGSGYPQGLKEKQIPLAARIFAIVDVWDALRSDRPYREAWPEEKVIKHIKAGSGSHFDPEVVETFLNMINKVNLERKKPLKK